MSERQIEVCGKSDAEIDPTRKVDFTLKGGTRVCRTGKRGDGVRPGSIYNRWTAYMETLKKIGRLCRQNSCSSGRRRNEDPARGIKAADYGPESARLGVGPKSEPPCARLAVNGGTIVR